VTSNLVRTWKGEAPETRVDARRTRLIEAALDLLGSDQPGQFTMRAACREAGLSQRYFYETFTDRDELAAATYERCYDTLRTATVSAVKGVDGTHERAHAAFAAAASVDESDLRIGRVMFREAQTDPTVRALAAKALPEFIDMMLMSEPNEANMAARERTWMLNYLAGGLFRLFDEWIAAGVPDRDAFVDFCTKTTVSALGW
jgi:AcrR family transcriptional regulator